MAVCWLLLTALASAQSPDYDSAGPYQAGYRTEDIPGTTEVMSDSRIYYPDSAGVIPGSAVPVPIVVFGHGWMMGIDRYLSYGEHLASWGYAAVLPTYSSPLIRPEHVQRARLLVDAAVFAAGLDTVAGDLFQGKLDRWNWGFCGHSLGGALSLLAADTFRLQDTLKVVVSLAGPQTDPPTRSQRLSVPKLLLPGGNDGIAPWEGVREAFWDSAPAPGTFAVISGANHGYYMDFSYPWENGGTATISRETQQAICRRHMTAYFERYLRDDLTPWNFLFTYGDSILGHASMESVEVRLEPVGLEEQRHQVPRRLVCESNPGLRQVALSYELPGPGAVSLTVYDPVGQQVRVLVRGQQSAGRHKVLWDGLDSDDRRVGSGCYLVRFESGAAREAELVQFLR